MPLADRMEITHVHARPAGDTYFPPIDAAQWREVARSEHPAGPRDEAAFSLRHLRPGLNSENGKDVSGQHVASSRRRAL